MNHETNHDMDTNVNIRRHLSLLGMPVKDRVTGFEGVVTSVGFDLYGCVQANVHPGMDDAGKLRDSLWFDVARLEVTATTPVMQRPYFKFGPVAQGKKGPAERPSFMKP